MSILSGAEFERRALAYLQRRGMKLLAHNVRCRRGEIDLVMRDANDTLVFVEVRARAHTSFASASASITAAKRSRLRMAAQFYLAQWRGPVPVCRFDVIAFDGTQITWLVDAFKLDE